MVEHLYRIDVHQHALLPEIAFTLMKSGITTIAGIPIPPWDRASALAMMDRQGIATAIVSNPYLALLLA